MQPTVDQLVQQAEIVINQRNYVQARNLLARALEQDVNNVRALELLALTELNTGNLELCMRVIDSCLSIDPESHYAVYIKALCYHKTDHHQQSLEYCLQAVAMHPQSVAYHCMLAVTQLNLGNVDEAEQSVATALQLRPQDDDALRLKSIVASRHGDYEQAMVAIDQSLGVNPENALAFTKKATYLLRDGKYNEAINVYEQALRLDPGNEDVKVGIFMAYKRSVPVIGKAMYGAFTHNPWADDREYVGLMMKTFLWLMLLVPLWYNAGVDKSHSFTGFVFGLSFLKAISYLGMLYGFAGFICTGMYKVVGVTANVMFNWLAMYLPKYKYFVPETKRREFNVSFLAFGFVVLTSFIIFLFSPLHGWASMCLSLAPVVASLLYLYYHKAYRFYANDLIVLVPIASMAFLLIFFVGDLYLVSIVCLTIYFFFYNRGYLKRIA